MANILGLPDTSKFDTESDYLNNYRRSILHIYPNGGSPLTGILSMMQREPVGAEGPTFYWHEKRYVAPKITLRGSGDNEVTTTAPSSATSSDGTDFAATSYSTTTNLWVKCEGTEDVRPGSVLHHVADDAHLRVMSVVHDTDPASNGYVQVRPVRAFTPTLANWVGGTTELSVISSVFGEGASGVGITPTVFKRPITVQNQTTITQTPFTFTGTVLQQGLKYDRTGPYMERAMDAQVEHMVLIEKNLIFGKRATVSTPSTDALQEDLNTRYTSGIIEFLDLWDEGSGTNYLIDGVAYNPYSHKGTDTADTDDTKRVIENTAGTISITTWNQWAERVTRTSSNRSRDRLVLCGSGALLALADMFRRNSQFTVTEGDKAYGLEFTTLTTPFAKFHFLTHPLLTEDATMRYWMLILDVHNLHFRAMLNRDTKLIKNCQPNDADYRKDKYITEWGLEMHEPESCMLIKNVQSYDASAD